MYEFVTPAKAGGPVGGCSPILDTGFRRYDGDFPLHRAEAMAIQMRRVLTVRLTSPLAARSGRKLAPQQVLDGLDLGAHFVGGFPDFIGQLLLVHVFSL